MDSVDPVEFGKLVQAVDQLQTDITEIKADVKLIREKGIERAGIRKGVLVTLVLLSGGLGAGLTKILEVLS